MYKRAITAAAIFAGSVCYSTAQNAAPQPVIFKVILLGTGGGPPMDLQRYGPSTLVEAGSETLLFDCGRDATLRMAQYGIPRATVRKLFITHLHSDHVIGIPDLFLTPWSAEGRRLPFEVWGPPGTRVMMDHMRKTFAFDIRIRRDVDEKFSREGIMVVSHDIREGVVFERSGVKVTAFLVDHGPVKPAYGYRVDYAGHSVALSGDTRFSENLIKFSQGVDVLIHEGDDAEADRAQLVNLTPDQIERIIAHHTPLDQAGQIFTRVKPRLAVYSHVSGTSESLVAGTRKTYSGPLVGGEDLMTIEIGDKIDVRRFRP
jgi:ribonuclease Z